MWSHFHAGGQATLLSKNAAYKYLHMKLLENIIPFYPNSTAQVAHDQVPRNFWQEYGHFFIT